MAVSETHESGDGPHGSDSGATPSGGHVAPPPIIVQVPAQGQPPQVIYVPAARSTTKTNGFSVAALVLGILWLYWIGSVLALIFGYVAKSQIDKSGGTQSGRGMAIAGIVLGWVGIGILVLLFVVGFGIGVSGIE